MHTRCDTTLVVSTEKQYPKNTGPVHEFQQAMGGDLHRMNLAALVPEPVPGNQEWRLKNWGTIEDIDVDYIESDVIVAGEYYLRFLSVDTPIVPWVKTVAKLYPDLDFNLDYFNVALGFEGELEVQGNNVLFEEMKEISVEEASQS